LLSGSLEHSMKLIELGVIPKLLTIAKNKSDENTRSSFFWAVGNIAGELKADIRDTLMNEGIWDFAKDILESNLDGIIKTDYIDNIGFFLMNIARTRPLLPSEITEKIIPGVCAIIKRWNKNTDILNTYLYILMYVSNDADASIIMKILENEMCPILINYMQDPSQKVYVPAMRIVGNIATSSNDITQKLLDCNVLDPLNLLIATPKQGIKKEVCWIISNITAGTQIQAEAVLNCGLLDKVVNIATAAAESIPVRKEAIWALINATTILKDSKYKDFMVKHALPCIVQCLKDTQITTEILNITLEGVENLLKSEFSEEIKIAFEELGGVEKLESLQTHENAQIYERCVKILEDFFAASELDENNDSENHPQDGVANQPPQNVQNQINQQYQNGSNPINFAFQQFP